MKKNLVFSMLFYFLAVITAQFYAQRNFTINYSSEGDVKANGIMTLDLTQTKAKLEGTANYKTNSGDLDTGMLSVNGYVKNNVGYVRFRDQRGGVLADGTISYTDAKTIKFVQTTSSNQLPKTAYLYDPNFDYSKPVPSTKPILNTSGSFGGKYSNEGDTTAKGILSFDLTQSGTKVEGTSTYNLFSGDSQSGLLSVNGYVKNGMAYIRFRNQKGEVIADGALHYEGKNVVFRQTTLSDWLPHYATLYR